jgi:hypothetical protein
MGGRELPRIEHAFTLVVSLSNDNEFATTEVVQAPLGKPPSKWTIKENRAWLQVREKKYPQTRQLPS